VFSGLEGRLLGFKDDFIGDERLKFTEAGADDSRFADLTDDSLLSLEAVTRDAKDRTLVARDLACLNELPGAGDGDAAGRLGKDARGLREKLDPLDHLVVGAILGTATSLPHAVDGIVAVGGSTNGQRLDDCLGILNWLHHVGSALEGGADRRAPRSLSPMDCELRLLDKAEVDEFLVGLVDLGQQGTGGHAGDRVAWKLPSKLLRDLEAHRLRALRIVGTEIHIHESPAILPGDLRAEAVHLIIGSLDADDIGAVNKGAEDFSLLQIGGDKHVALQACIGGIGGDRVSQITRGGTRHYLESELLGTTQGDRDHAIFEGERRVVDRVILDPEFTDPESLGKTVGLDQRCESYLRADRRLPVDRKEFAVAPHRLWSGLDEFAGQDLADRLVVIGGLKRAEVKLANMDRLFLIEASALAAFQIAEVGFFGHGISSLFPLKSDEET